MTEPIYIAQTGEIGADDADGVRDWLDKRAAEAVAAGCLLIRASVSEEVLPGHFLILIEGWGVRPDDQGEPRWILGPGKAA